MPDSSPTEPIVVVGAGIAGLACARALAAAGRPVVVIERARGVGGRCATRHIEGQAVDFGVLFFHGRAADLRPPTGPAPPSPGLIEALEEVPATMLRGWPNVVQGAGRPCQPAAFEPGEQRLAFAEGVSAFPKHLARGLSVRLGARASSFDVEGGAIHLRLEGGSVLKARTAVLALATEQALGLLGASTATAPSLAMARELLGMVRSRPCLAVMAGYPLDAPAPPWDVCYPEDSSVLQILSHESTKRASPPYRALVYQAHARWSREHLDDAGWIDTLLAEAGRLLGPWAARPRFVQGHRWRHARTDLGAELSAPLFLELPGGARLGLAGELFAPGGGVAGAWTAGDRLARRILAEDKP